MWIIQVGELAMCFSYSIEYDKSHAAVQCIDLICYMPKVKSSKALTENIKHNACENLIGLRHDMLFSYTESDRVASCKLISLNQYRPE